MARGDAIPMLQRAHYGQHYGPRMEMLNHQQRPGQQLIDAASVQQLHEKRFALTFTRHLRRMTQHGHAHSFISGIKGPAQHRMCPERIERCEGLRIAPVVCTAA